MVQALLEFNKRTEYKVLKQFVECHFVSVKELMQGELVVPGYTLKKMADDELCYLNRWLDCPENHLFLMPSWYGMNLAPLFQLPISLEVMSMEEVNYYEEIPVNYKIKGKYKDKLFATDRDVFGVRLRKDTGSGFITVITLPLLDYKLPHLHEKFQVMLQALLMLEDRTVKKPELTPKMFEPEDVHIHLLILLAAGEDFSSGLSHKLERYFFYRVNEDILTVKAEELKAAGFIEDSRLTPQATEFLEEKKLKAFIRVIRERRENADGWE